MKGTFFPLKKVLKLKNLTRDITEHNITNGGLFLNSTTEKYCSQVFLNPLIYFLCWKKRFQKIVKGTFFPLKKVLKLKNLTRDMPENNKTNGGLSLNSTTEKYCSHFKSINILSLLEKRFQKNRVKGIFFPLKKVPKLKNLT